MLSSESFITKLGLEGPRDYFQSWLGIFWLLSLALTISDIVVPIYHYCIKKYKQRKHLKNRQKYLHDLTVGEKSLLSEYIDNNTKTVIGQLSDGVVQGLVTNEVIRLASTLSQYDDYFPYNIQPWAWKYLHENQDLLK